MQFFRIDESIYRPYGGLIQEFISGHGQLQALFPDRFKFDLLDEAMAHRKSFPVDRNLLVDAIKLQYESAHLKISQSAILTNQLSKLNDENTFTFTTGHQLNIFGGPLYYIIKALHVIKMADEANKLGKAHFVPIFWLATEDHDFAEINHAHLFGKTLIWNDEKGGKTGAYETHSMREVLDEMSNLMGESTSASDLKEIFESAYGSGKSLAQSARILLHELFGERGLVILDGDDIALKHRFIPMMKRELEEQVMFREVSRTIEQFESQPIQVNPREINLFYLDAESRERIQIRDENYFLDSGKSWSKNEIVSELEIHPERFSPNVIFRPVYQEVILPNLAYIGGPGEVAYWMELKSSFDNFSVFLPMIGLRNSIMWLDLHKLKKLNKLDLQFQDVFLSEPDITKKLVKFDEMSDEIDGDIQSLQQAVNSIADKTAEVDESVKAFVLAEGRRIEKSIEQIIKRFIKAKKHKNEEAVKSFWTVHEKLFPNGSLHERYDNFVPYYLQHGDAFFQTIYEQIDAEDARLIVVQE